MTLALFLALAALAVIEVLAIAFAVALSKAAAKRPPKPLTGPRRRPGGGWTN